MAYVWQQQHTLLFCEICTCCDSNAYQPLWIISDLANVDHISLSNVTSFMGAAFVCDLETFKGQKFLDR